MNIYDILGRLTTKELLQLAEEINDPSGVIPDDGIARRVACEVFNKETPGDVSLLELVSLGAPLSLVLAKRLFPNRH